jgi:hypothetical protein
LRKYVSGLRERGANAKGVGNSVSKRGGRNKGSKINCVEFILFLGGGGNQLNAKSAQFPI